MILSKTFKEKEENRLSGNFHCTITIENNFSHFEGYFPIHLIVDYTSFFKSGYEFSPRFRAGSWDGRIRLYNRFKKTLPTGLLSVVLEVFSEAGVSVKIIDNRRIPSKPPVPLEKIKFPDVSFDYPFDYQLEAARRMIEDKQGILAAATNSGKTTIAALVIASLGVPTLFMVPNRTLLYQTQKVFSERLQVPLNDIGIIGDSHWKPKPWITVATVDTLHSRIKKPVCLAFLKGIDLLLIDECHHQAADSWFEVTKNCPAYYRLSMSGTPLDRTDGADLKLISVTGPVIYQIKNKELIERGISVQPVIHVFKIKTPHMHPKTFYAEAYGLGIVENKERNELLVKKTLDFIDQGLSALVLVREIKHGEILSKLFEQFNGFSIYPHLFISGKESMDSRNKALKDFKHGEIKILIATSILNEGFDMPNIDVLTMAAGGKSQINLLQRVGRGLRKGGNSEYLHVIDTADFQQNHLLKHSLERLSSYKREDCFQIIPEN